MQILLYYCGILNELINFKFEEPEKDEINKREREIEKKIHR
jgi:hypothetical protein